MGSTLTEDALPPPPVSYLGILILFIFDYRTQKREMGLAMMLFCVVIVFFLCNILALVVNLLEVQYCTLYK